MMKFITVLALSVILVSCEDTSRIKSDINNDAIRPAFSTLEFSEFESLGLQSLCKSLPNLVIDGSVQHEFDYKKEVCSELKESYRQGQKVDLNGFYPIYVANNRSLFHFPEVRFDMTEQGHALSLYCKPILTSGLIPGREQTIGSFKYTLEVIVNHSEKEFIKNTPGCFDSTMLAANSSNQLVCLRLWKEQLGNNQAVIQQLSYESMTFVVSSALTNLSGYAVHRKKYDYLQCTDKTKALVYEATRIK